MVQADADRPSNEEASTMRMLLVAIGATALAAACGAASAFADAYLGLDVVKRTEGLMVWRVLPGPLDGNFVSSHSLARGDLIASIDGEPAVASVWEALGSRPIGSSVRIAYREGRVRGASGAPDPNGALREIAVTLDDAAVWRGWHRSGELPPLPDIARAADTPRGDLDAGLALLGPEARQRSQAVLASLDGIAAKHGDPATPPLLRAVFHTPGETESIVRAAVPNADAMRSAPFRGAALLAAGLAAVPASALPDPHGTFKIEHAQAGVWYLDFLLNGARARFEEWVKPTEARLPGLRPLVVERLDNLLVRGQNARVAMEALRAIPTLPPEKAAVLVAHFDVRPELGSDLAALSPETLPEALRGAVEGDILAASDIAEIGWVVFGGRGSNRYDLGRVAAVLDLGGDDRYEWNHVQAAHRLVVDLSGNDRHRGGAIGPAGSLGAIAVIDDHAGDDRYEGGELTAGTALGVSLIVDRGGNDHYSGGAWSLGSAAGGVAMVVDLSGSDRVHGEGMAIGVGGPSGVGAFVDVAGDDVATLGTLPSVYGLEGERAGFGMGFGLGFRMAAAGGVGAYVDYAGRDLRQSGEFSQGCGYYLGLGVLVDLEGDDVAVCDRYGIGGSAHQAAGVYLDVAGNDSYAARTAAHLGGAWDESLSLFVDTAGDDNYRADGLALGAAAQQAVGIAVDRAGNDAYRAGGGSLGAAGDNEYHFDQAGLGSFALFLDLGGADLYPSPRMDGATTVSSEAAPARARGADAVFHDAPPAAAASGTGANRTGKASES
jgi:hypothetical protein